MKLARPPSSRRPGENTIPLINIVFLMLIFFLIAGTLAPPLDPDVSLITSRDGAPVPPPDALVASAAGELRFRGAAVTAEAFVASLQPEADETRPAVRLAADRALAAERLIDIVLALKAAGAGSVTVITERAP